MKTDSKKIIPLFFAIFAFLLLIIGASFAYFSTDIKSTNKANISTSLPNKTVIYTDANSCTLDLDYQTMFGGTPNNQVPVATSNCYLEVSVYGDNSAYCLYDISLVDIGEDEYIPSNGVGVSPYPYEFTGKIYLGNDTATGTLIKSENNINSLVGDMLTNQRIDIVTAGSEVKKKYIFEISWYNLNLDQSSQLGKNHSYYITASNISC